MLSLRVDPLVVAGHLLLLFSAEVLVLAANLLRVVNWWASVLLKLVLSVHLLVPFLLSQELSQILFILCNQLIPSVAFKLEISLFPDELSKTYLASSRSNIFSSCLRALVLAI